MQDSTASNETVSKVICDKHGDLTSDRETDPQDHVVATLVRDEHLEQCPGPVSIEEFTEGELSLKPASQIAERQKERHGHREETQHCERCMAFVGGGQEECSRCGAPVQEAA